MRRQAASVLGGGAAARRGDARRGALLRGACAWPPLRFVRNLSVEARRQRELAQCNAMGENFFHVVKK